MCNVIVIPRTLITSLPSPLCLPPSNPTTYSYKLFSELENAGFNIQERGQIEVKGKGQMTTYFLLGNLLVSEDGIMGKEDGGTCLYTEDLRGQRKKGEQNIENDCMMTAVIVV